MQLKAMELKSKMKWNLGSELRSEKNLTKSTKTYIPIPKGIYCK